jgi:hypothetical protein
MKEKNKFCDEARNKYLFNVTDKDMTMMDDMPVNN